MSSNRIPRRKVIKALLGTAALCALGQGARQRRLQAAAAPPPLSVKVLLGERIGIIRPTLYSHFAEHIGGVIYDGIWVGPDSKVPNIDGIRHSLLEHVRRLGKVAVRWPGGCFADKYHWRDGVGPREKRPRRFGRWREVTEPNHFGTHELLRFCRLAGVEPYFAANVGTGSAEEFQQWIEYVNAPAGSTSIAEEREANGEKEPFKVRYWGVGNESWGCGGKFTPEDYATEYRKFTEWLPGYDVPLFLIAAGPNGNDVEWTKRFFKKWADYAHAPLSGWAPHYYCGTTGHALNFSSDQWYEMLQKGNQMEKLIRDQWAALAELDPDHKVKLVIDEWGAWHPQGTEINPRHLFEQMGCLRDALVAALTLDTFNRHADKMEMANIAQLVNNLHSLFLADGEKLVATPTFHVFEMYRSHHDAQAVRIEMEAPEVPFKIGEQEAKIFRLAGSASVSDKSLTITLVHTHASEPAEVAVDLGGGRALEARQTVLSHNALNAHNSFETPAEVIPHSAPLPVVRPSLRLVLPPASISRLDVKLG
jgi:alpha-N-arabinofuranosidase